MQAVHRTELYTIPAHSSRIVMRGIAASKKAKKGQKFDITIIRLHLLLDIKMIIKLLLITILLIGALLKQLDNVTYETRCLHSIRKKLLASYTSPEVIIIIIVLRNIHG